MNISNIDEQIKAFKSAIDKSNRIVGFTGAGISTESDIPDYRSKGGIWGKFKPVYFDEFVSDEKKRVLYWQRKLEMWESMKNAKPNKGHMFFKDLNDEHKLMGVITQNIDGLHEKSGLPKDIMVNLHGNNLETICLKCGFILPSGKALDDLNLDEGVPLCSKCGGLLKPNTISFGQQLNEEDLEKAHTLSATCDLMIVVGSTLVVQPAASFPLIAKQNNAILAIITLSETPLDNDADFVFHQKMGNFLELIS